MTAPIKMYSQNDEEAYILENTPATGRFLDIGAWHPEQYSNTRALYERGWSGVMIDPAPAAVEALLKAYGRNPRVSIVPAMIGTERGLRELHVSDGPYSTAHQEAAERFSHIADFRGSLWVPQLRLDDIINRWGPFHFVNIDVEGGSVDLLKEVLVSPMHPPCICAEHDGRHFEAISLAEACGYRFVHGNDTNLIFAS